MPLNDQNSKHTQAYSSLDIKKLYFYGFKSLQNKQCNEYLCS
jgi:hypothetical protein